MKVGIYVFVEKNLLLLTVYKTNALTKSPPWTRYWNHSAFGYFVSDI